MALLWKDFRDRIRRTLDDTSASVTWSSTELLDYLDAAMRRLALHTAREVVWSYTATADTSAVTLPDDILALGPVWFPDRELLTPIDLQPGFLFQDATITTESLPIGYYRWPGGTLNLTRALGSGDALTVYYWAYWTPVVEDTDALLVPRWAVEALEWYIVYRSLTRPGIQQAMLGQYDSKQDSGHPEHNPLEKYSKYCLLQFDRILTEYSPQDRSGWDRVIT